ncbi:MAG: hypothetical protein WCA46_28095 [Actinocatenispora sp.]
MSSLAVVIGGLAGVAVVGGGAAAAAAGARREYPYLATGHAHNDYKHRWPLESALRYGYASVEADVVPTAPGEAPDLLVGHGRHEVAPDRTLRGGYLDPLSRRVAGFGSVHSGQSHPFQLLVELKGEPDRCYRILSDQLAPYDSMLTSYRDGVVHHGAVIVVVTGARIPYELCAAESDRHVFCDGSLSDVESAGLPATVVPLVSEDWSAMFGWRGRGPLPDDQRDRLRDLADRAHEDDRKLRIWGFPGWPARVRTAFWREFSAAGVDFLASDNLRALHAFYRRSGGPPEPDRRTDRPTD